MMLPYRAFEFLILIDLPGWTRAVLLLCFRMSALLQVQRLYASCPVSYFRVFLLDFMSRKCVVPYPLLCISLDYVRAHSFWRIALTFSVFMMNKTKPSCLAPRGALLTVDTRYLDIEVLETYIMFLCVIYKRFIGSGCKRRSI